MRLGETSHGGRGHGARGRNCRIVLWNEEWIGSTIQPQGGDKWMGGRGHVSDQGTESHLGRVPWEPESLLGREWGHARALGLRVESCRGGGRSHCRSWELGHWATSPRLEVE